MYQLIDFGAGRKLESLSGYTIERPSPAAENVRRLQPRRWDNVDSVYDSSRKQWIHRSPWQEGLNIDCGDFRMPVRPTPFGHIGVFPEQSGNWRWLSLKPVSWKGPERPLALNLFAYTGASTIALSSARYDVVHVDAAKPNVAAAKEAARFNGLQAAPIRYLVDDARALVAREVRRQRQYHTLVLDPPAYGHTPKGKTWRLERDLWPLIDNCLHLIDPACFRLLVTGHSPQVAERDVIDHLRKSDRLRSVFRRDALVTTAERSTLSDSAGRHLDAGFYVRVETGD
ncbi:class I SAM-dependent methyltransferase [Novipirellula artificiosorum]|uniref:23S rRNA m(2)G2445 methyltransferase n=1 Tax=Novipirellula artificiosorum TaxID=2528016 RepID=A0A5C6E113_9BACT|nr:class I SAM-dependent methyltransferase [Novipirellula artificiosorum]TWU40869.1 23S rRNA m(2)G2445 methyltransferase [Novipirellula artificiosorum]